jgi:predicted PhzF superfamily epimerase YddE/YHI9
MCFRQGNNPDSLSTVFWEIDKSSGDLNSVYVGGLAVTSIERKIEIDSKSDEIIFV